MASARDKNVENIADIVSSDSDTDSAGDDWDNCDKDENIIINSQCLFCDKTFPFPELCWKHCEIHGFNIEDAKRKFKLDCFSYIKMVNYCRSRNVSAANILLVDECEWQSDEFLIPFIQDDGMLQFDIEADTDAPVESFNCFKQAGSACPENSRDTEINELQMALAAATHDMEKMKAAATKMSLWCQDEKIVPHLESAIHSLQNDEDDAYFSSYGHFSIHQEMLKDDIRTNYYKDCINNNRHLIKDKVVLDVGCGTAILSMLAAKAGAKLVIGVEMSDIIYQAMDIVQENGLSDKITLIKGRMEDVALPVEKVDVIISEWMGYFLLFESMLDTVLWARDNYLVPGGHLLPDFSSISIVGMEDETMHKENVHYWNDVYGFKMSCMRTAVLEEASVTVVNPENNFTEPSTLKCIDINNCVAKDLDYSTLFTLKSHKGIEITALVGYFDISWKSCSETMSFSTSPFEKSTHWKQTVFLLQDPVYLTAGETVEGKLICRKNRKDPRSLTVTISINGKTQKYLMQ